MGRGPRSAGLAGSSQRTSRGLGASTGSKGAGGSSGGILSKLFSRGNSTGGAAAKAATSGFQRSGAAAGGSVLKSVANTGNIQSFLTNTQQMIKTAQSVTPMIQQYGPIVKNLPAMWKLYRGLSADTDATEAVEETAAVETVATEDVVASTEENSETTEETSESIQTKTKKKRKPTTSSNDGPKLYI
ncbi:hypothetical protein G8O30_07985 [Mangrovibacillus cuniculi]|uniref:YqfQ-like protein n=2 Tax=Mangrovibacillus cuniculi TaxID=2593652 RepID=A0A7S8CEA7_9BACI|nr:hypothetical protein G8O30_07985 [Mangrovibacillus cuniculi]